MKKLTVALLALAAPLATALAGTWTYSGDATDGTLSHDSTPWVLQVSRSGNDLTVTAAWIFGTSLPLSDTVSGGLSVTSIGDSAFRDCTDLTDVMIPSTVISIGNAAFSDCTGLTGVTIPSSVTTIGASAFSGCTGLTGVTIPSSVTNIGEVAFYDCTGLTDVAWLGVCPQTVGSYLYYNSPNITSYVYSAFSDNWQSQVTSGSLSDGTAVWQDRPIRQLPGDGTYTVTLDCNGGTGGVASVTATLGLVLPHADIPGQAGFAFTGYWDAPSGGVQYVDADGNGIRVWDKLDAATLYACWEALPASVNVTFDGNGGSVSPASKTVTAGGVYGGLPVPVHAGCVFIGWRTVWMGGSYVTESTVVAQSADHTLYADWVPVCGPPLWPDIPSALGGGQTWGWEITPVCDCRGQGWPSALAWDWSGAQVDGDSVLVTDGWLSTQVRGAGTLMFWYSVGAGGRLDFYADGGAARLTADVADDGWRTACVPISVNKLHDLKWVARNARVDQVAWLPGVTVQGPVSAGPGEYGGDSDTGFFPGADEWRAFMSGPSAYLSHPGEAMLAAAGQYGGWLYAGGARPEARGTLSVKISKVSGTLTVKAVLPGGSVSFPAVKKWGWFARYGYGVTLAAKTGETVTLYFNRDRLWGGATGGRFGGGALLADGARNRYADAKDAAAKLELEAGYKGYYTVQLPWSGANPPVALRPGAGYLTLTVGAKGAVKYAGKLADGAAVSGSAPLCAFRACRDDAAVPVFKELYSKKGSVGGLLWIDPAGPARTDRGLGWEIAWRRAGASGPAFLESAGGWFTKNQSFGQGGVTFYSAAG
jgi:hypothetical protein